MIESILKKIGLSDKEVAVYLASLRTGPAPIRKIAQESGINRGTTYDILKSLQELGLVAYYHKDKHQYFIAEPPSRLRDAIDQKQQMLEKTKSEITAIIPELTSMHDRAGSKPVVKYYEGDAAVMTILRDVISSCVATSQKEYYVYSSSAIKEQLYRVYPKFSDDRIAAGIHVTVLSMGGGGEMRGLDERRWLSKQESAPTYTLLYADKVGIISIGADRQPLGIITEDKNIYQTQRMIFESVWASAQA